MAETLEFSVFETLYYRNSTAVKVKIHDVIMNNYSCFKKRKNEIICELPNKKQLLHAELEKCLKGNIMFVVYRNAAVRNEEQLKSVFERWSLEIERTEFCFFVHFLTPE